jgi:hypothetical protein
MDVVPLGEEISEAVSKIQARESWDNEITHETVKGFIQCLLDADRITLVEFEKYLEYWAEIY